jgi:hypothetical protein
VALACILAAIGVTGTATTAAIAQQTGLEALDQEAFGDMFVHPRDRFYLPGKAPSRAMLDTTTTLEDSRGQVNRYEYSKNNTFISRETWVDERGESQGRIGIGRKF